MTTVLVIVGAIVIVAGIYWLFMRLARASLQRLERRREAWRAGGRVGPEPERSTLRLHEDAAWRPGKAPPGLRPGAVATVYDDGDAESCWCTW